MATSRRRDVLILSALVGGVLLHFLPPVPSHRAPDAAPPAPAATAADALAPYVLDENHAVQHPLPRHLKEVSGLAMTTDHRLLAHDDERGVVSEVDTATGDVRSTFVVTFEGTPMAADFEGIAVLDDHVYLATSDAVIYECPQGTDGQSVACDRHETGLGAEYELESLATAAGGRELILVSKNPRSKALAGLVCIDRWSAEQKRLVAGERVTVPFAAFTAQLDDDTFQPSGVEVDPTTGNYLILAARQRSLAEVTPEGTVLAVVTLPKRLHWQPEGIAIGAEGALLIADEGDDGTGRLTIYARAGQLPSLPTRRP
jgi:uncharacterized protein YjiK